jgi:hypothetical protein
MSDYYLVVKAHVDGCGGEDTGRQRNVTVLLGVLNDGHKRAATRRNKERWRHRHREQSLSSEVEHEWGMIGWLLGVIPDGALIGVNPN